MDHNITLYIILGVVGLIIDIGIIAWCAVLAGRKGYSAGLWGFLAFLIGIIALIIVACLEDRAFRHDERVMMNSVWICRNCGKTNRRGSKVCSDCGTPEKFWTCPVCGILNNYGETVCKNCGTKIKIKGQ